MVVLTMAVALQKNYRCSGIGATAWLQWPNASQARTPKNTLSFETGSVAVLLFRRRSILVRIGHKLPVVSCGLAPDNLITNHAARCGRRTPLERGVVIQVRGDHAHVLRHTRGKRQGRERCNVQRATSAI